MFANTFYRNYEFSADDNILVLYEKYKMTEKVKIAISTIINKSLSGKYSYGKQFRQGSFNQEKIQLPITPTGEIDFHFMENFIAELEAERLAELEAYLLATGLSNYTLTKKEEKTLAQFDKNIKGG